MNTHPLLHAIHLPLRNPRQIAAALRNARLCSERASAPLITLFFCDLPDASAAQLPGDADLIRCVQSGVMSMNARRPGAYFFLVRRRSRSAELMTYLGEHQTPGVKTTLAQLLSGKNSLRFEASNFSPASLAGAFDAVLITHASLCMPPDLPARMLEALLSSGKAALRGEVVIPFRREEPLLARLLREGFTLDPPGIHENTHEPSAAIYRADALDGDFPACAADGCRFVLNELPTLEDLFFDALSNHLCMKNNRFLFPLLQLAVLLASAFFGWQWPALAALFLPELPSLLHPRQLPGALVRLCLLPRRALAAINALLYRRLSRFSFCVLCSAGSGNGVFFGLLTLFLAARSVGALAVCLPLSLLWLFSPAVERALSLPVRERIPLDEAEEKTLRTLTLNAFNALSPDAASPAHLLAVCAGCMLRELEADEAARRAQRMLGRFTPAGAFDAACLLCAAQFFAENMASCDAALRTLPSELEACAAVYRSDGENGVLSALLRIAQENMPSSEAERLLRSAGAGDAMDGLFLRTVPDVPALFPITHPHAFLRQAMGDTEKSDPPSEMEKANRFLILACAALNAPFYPLLLRSAVIAPYTPILDVCDI